MNDMAVTGIRVRDYTQLRQAIATRRRQLGLRQLEADEITGLQSGYQGKIEAGVRKLGDLSLPMILAGLDLDMLLVPRSATAPVFERTGSAMVQGDRRALPPTGEC